MKKVKSSQLQLFLQQKIIGETFQPAAKRFSQHFPRLTVQEEKPAVALHHIEEHPEEEQNCKMAVLTKTQGFVDRNCTEAVLIQEFAPELNRRLEGAGAMCLYL